MAPSVTRTDVLAMLASYGDRPVSAVGEGIDSLELAWLLHQAEQRYGALEVTDDDLSAMSTVDATVAVLRRVIPASAPSLAGQAVPAAPGDAP